MGQVASNPETLAVIHADAGCTVGVVHNVVVAVARESRRAYDDERIIDALRTATATASAEERQVAFLVVYEPKAKTMSPKLRQAIASTYQELGPRVGCIARVIEGQGFLAAAIHSMIAAIGAMARVNVPARNFATVEEAAGWIGEIAGPQAEYGLRLGIPRLRAPG